MEDSPRTTSSTSFEMVLKLDFLKFDLVKTTVGIKANATTPELYDLDSTAVITTKLAKDTFIEANWDSSQTKH